MILVTGATGFLGKRVCKMLNELNLEFYPSSMSLGTDLREMSQTMKLFEDVKPEFVLNCSAFVGGIQFGYKHQAEIFRNNMLITINLLEACKLYGVKRIVNPISNCAYPGEATFFKENEFWNGPLHESVLVYGMARKMSYIGSVAYSKQFNMDTINLILSNMYGPEDHFDEERSHALGALIKKIVDAKFNNDESVIVWGTGKPIREWLFVDDGAKALILALHIAPYIDPINIGVGKGISIHDLAYLIKDIVQFEGSLLFDSTKPDGAAYKTVDGSLGEVKLGWKPSTDLFDGIRETVKWYIDNLKG